MGVLSCIPFLMVLTIMLGQNCRGDNLDYSPWDKTEIKKEARLYDAELEKVLRAILKSGLGDIIPPLDPLELPILALNETDMPGIMLVDHLLLENLYLEGLSSFEATKLSVSVSPLGIAFDLTFRLSANASFIDFSVIIGELLPFYGNGSVDLSLGLRLNGLISVKTNENSFLYISSLTAGIEFNYLQVHVESLLGLTDGKAYETFNILLGDVTPDTIEFMLPTVLPGLLESLRTMINGPLLELELTFADLICCLNPTPTCCPFELPSL